MSVSQKVNWDERKGMTRKGMLHRERKRRVSGWGVEMHMVKGLWERMNESKRVHYG